MEVLSLKHPGIFFICENCSVLIANVQESDVYADNIVYCPICKHCNHILYDKKYDGTVKEGKSD